MMAYAFPKHFTITTSSEASKSLVDIAKRKRELELLKGNSIKYYAKDQVLATGISLKKAQIFLPMAFGIELSEAYKISKPFSPELIQMAEGPFKKLEPRRTR